jgi:hypothetical protein
MLYVAQKLDISLGSRSWQAKCEENVQLAHAYSEIRGMIAYFPSHFMYLIALQVECSESVRQYLSLLQAGGIDVLKQLLGHVGELLDADNLLALAQENDHTYLCWSLFFQKLLDVAELFLLPLAAEALMHDTHCKFLEKMLSRRSFNTMRALVREVNSWLCRACNWREQHEDTPSADAKLVPLLECLETHNVVEELLTVNMHQWQYVESLQQLLTTLAEVHALSKETLRSLWGQLRQVCTSAC